MIRRAFVVTLFAALLCPLYATPVFANSYPSRKVEIVVPFPPGGVTDMLARALARQLGKLWGQSVIVLNAPGAGSIIGADKVAHASPDGYKLLLTIDPTVVNNRFVYKKLPYDPDKSLVPITMLARAGLLIVATPSFPPNNLHELVAAARRAPRPFAYASAGIGTQTNLILAMIAKRAGIKLLQVPYKGGVMPDLRAVMAGQVKLTVAAPAVAAGLVKAGKIKALAITGTQRSSRLPDIPTIAESGYPGIRYSIWWGMFAPGGTSPQLVKRLNHDVVGIIKRPEFIRKYISPHALDLIADTPTQFEAAIRADVKRIAVMVKAAGVKPK